MCHLEEECLCRMISMSAMSFGGPQQRQNNDLFIFHGNQILLVGNFMSQNCDGCTKVWTES